MDDQFRTGEVTAQPLGDGRVLLHSLTSGTVTTATEAEVNLLRSCDAYRSLEEQARRWAARIELQPVRQAAADGPRWLGRLISRSAAAAQPSSTKVQEGLGMLQRLLEAGLLERRDRFFAEASAQRIGEPKGPIRRIGLPTRNRPVALSRALDSFIGSFRRYERELDWLIVDDGRTADEQDSTRAAVKAASARLSAPIRYSDRADREGYARRIADQSGVALETVRFALLGDERCPLTTGAARNAALLDAAGERVLYADDDALCRTALSPEPGADVAVSSHPDPTGMWFFRSREELLAGVRFEEVDLVGAYEDLLGWGVGDVLAEVGPDPVDLTWMTPGFERRLRSRPTRVRIAMAGVVGDSGIGASGYLFVAPQNRPRLLRDQAFYEAAVASRQLLRVAPSATLSDSTFCMAGNMGVDHRDLAPPFIPVQRNAEGGMARLLKLCFAGDCQAFAPVAVDHAPMEFREQSLDQWWEDLRRIRFPEAVRALIDASAPPPSDDPAHNLAHIGARLEDLAAAPAELERALRAGLIAEQGPRVARDRSRDQQSLPDYYRELRERQLAILREALASPGYSVPRDLIELGISESEARKLSRELIGRLGAMLRAWPAIRDAAAYLNDRGQGLGR